MKPSSTAKTVCDMIVQQLGGGRFFMMTGSKPQAYGTNDSGNDFMTMKLTRNSSGANYIRIELTPMDTYTMTFISCRGASMTTKAIKENVYCDNLQSIFTDVTGLYTSL